MRFNYYDEVVPQFGDVLSVPSKMRLHERLLMYSLVAGLEPARMLEIGTDQGGTARIIVEAMRYVGHGKLVCVDPAPVWNDDLHLTGNATLIVGSSPQALPECYQAAGGLFDMVLIDGNHEYDFVMADLRGVMPYLADGSRILLHDYLYPPVMRAIRDCLNENANVIDGGPLTKQPIDYQGLTQGGLYTLLVRGRE